MTAVPPLLGVSTSLKDGARSASRALLHRAFGPLRGVYPNLQVLDLREVGLPMFDGRLPADHSDPTVGRVFAQVSSAAAVLFSVPCYWSGVSGVFKNFVDILCGPAYDLDTVETVFTNKPVSLIVVGADAVSTVEGSESACRIMRSTGARLVGEPLLVSNPRQADAQPDLARRLVEIGAVLAREALVSGR